jgi:hypothetical protein
VDLEAAGSAEARNVGESELLAGSRRTGVDNENVSALGGCTRVIFRGGGGGRSGEGSEGLGGSSNGSVLAESEKLFVGDNADFLVVEL